MSAAVSRTPGDLTIRPRDIAFGRGRQPERWWLNGDPVGSAVFDALSATFPQGERFFMDSLRPYRDRVPPALRAQIAAFITQEALHTREHVAFNRHIVEHGRDLAAMEARSKAMLDEGRARAPHVQLAATVAMEHFTAILAHLVLSDPALLEGADPETARLWRWHSIEEIEHKGVAYDTFLHISAHIPAHKLWLFRSSVMLHTTGRFLKSIGRNVLQILREDGLDDGATRRALLRYLLVSPGVLARVIGPWLAFFRPGFHPWDHDDRALIAEAERELAAVA
jgi:predicted metal-dependent hydrolase